MLYGLAGNVQPMFFLVRNYASNGVGIVIAFKNLSTLGTCFQVFHTISDKQWDNEQQRAQEKR